MEIRHRFSNVHNMRPFSFLYGRSLQGFSWFHYWLEVRSLEVSECHIPKTKAESS